MRDSACEDANHNDDTEYLSPADIPFGARALRPSSNLLCRARPGNLERPNHPGDVSNTQFPAEDGELHELTDERVITPSFLECTPQDGDLVLQDLRAVLCCQLGSTEHTPKLRSFHAFRDTLEACNGIVRDDVVTETGHFRLGRLVTDCHDTDVVPLLCDVLDEAHDRAPDMTGARKRTASASSRRSVAAITSMGPVRF